MERGENKQRVIYMAFVLVHKVRREWAATGESGGKFARGGNNKRAPARVSRNG